MEITRADSIAEQLEELIFTGFYKDGERLDEIKLADHFGVSRTPIRDALQRLVIAGMAEQIPRRGVFVRQPGPVELFEMFEVMAELEASCGRLAASRISDQGVLRLKELNLACLRAIEEGDTGKYYLENELFHQEIYKAAANGFLEKKALRLQNRLKPYRRAQLRFRGRMGQSMVEHEAIVSALELGDGDLAANALRGHVAIQGERFHKLLTNLEKLAG